MNADSLLFLSRLHRADDRVALVVIARPSGRVRQRIVRVADLVSRRWQGWLAHVNGRESCDLYVSVNPLQAAARGRTKADIAEVRHAFLDVDHEGEVVRGCLGSHATIPPPMVVVDSSPGKLQAIWRVVGASADDVEAIQRGLVGEFGGDPAATDVTRVCRLPGFLNWKYSPPVLVTATWGPLVYVGGGTFPRVDAVVSPMRTPKPRRRDGRLSQSERDWRAVRLALARGVDAAVLIDALAQSRPDKRDAVDYAQRTVRQVLDRALRPRPLRHVLKCHANNLD